jgi:hypothetical protein
VAVVYARYTRHACLLGSGSCRLSLRGAGAGAGALPMDSGTPVARVSGYGAVMQGNVHCDFSSACLERDDDEMLVFPVFPC